MQQLNAIIPARGGSKGVPGKNIKQLNGIPLLAYPIIAAKESKYINNIYVSTDDTAIAQVALEYGALVIDRPQEFATDLSLDIDVMRHAVKHLNSSDDIVHLRATTPIIKSSVIDKAIEYFSSRLECTGLRSAHEASETAYKSFKQVGDYWQGLFNSEFSSNDYYNWPRQSLPETFQPNGYIDILKPTHFMLDDNLHGDRMLAFITPYAHEVDTIEDFKILEAIHG